jgi:hypothetical protein
MKTRLLYGIYINLLIVTACNSPKELFESKEFKENNRSSEIIIKNEPGKLMQFLDYTVYKDTGIRSGRKDSLANLGIITDRSSFTQINSESEMHFGNDSVKCIINYYSFTNSQNTVPAIKDLNAEKLYIPEKQPETKLINARLSGTIQYPGFKNMIPFYYNNHSGYILINRDSFVLKPIYQGKWIPLQTLVGVQLVKENMVYGLVYFFTGLLRKQVFLYTKASTAEQMLIAAYFAVIIRYL